MNNKTGGKQKLPHTIKIRILQTKNFEYTMNQQINVECHCHYTNGIKINQI